MPVRPSALTMPTVTVCCKPNGLPIATTQSPTSRRAEPPSGHLGQMRLLHPQHRDIRALIAPDHACRDSPVVEQGDGDLAGVLYDVPVRDDVALARIHDHARSGALKLAMPHGGLVRHVEKSPEEGILEQRVGVLD